MLIIQECVQSLVNELLMLHVWQLRFVLRAIEQALLTIVLAVRFRDTIECMKASKRLQ
jgi:hypothetical protein